MKKVLLTISVLLVIGCYPKGLEKSNGNFYYEVVTIKEHDYIMVSTVNGGAAIVHAGSCINPVHAANPTEK